MGGLLLSTHYMQHEMQPPLLVGKLKVTEVKLPGQVQILNGRAEI